MRLHSSTRQQLEINTSTSARIKTSCTFEHIDPLYSDSSELEIAAISNKILIPYSTFALYIEVLIVIITCIDKQNTNNVVCNIVTGINRKVESPSITLGYLESLRYYEGSWHHHLADGSEVGSGAIGVIPQLAISYNIDGGNADSIYTTEQIINGQP
jgi:hypothetical protein